MMNGECGMVGVGRGSRVRGKGSSEFWVLSSEFETDKKAKTCESGGQGRSGTREGLGVRREA